MLLSKLKVQNFNLHFILLLFILFLAAFLRFYRLPEMVNFDFDQEYAVKFANEVFNYFPIKMVGQGLSIMGLFMGPFYFYYLTPFFWITNFHPLGGYIGSIIFGLIIIGAYYYIGKKLFNPTAGLIAAFLYAINFEYIVQDWSMVPSYHSALLVLLTWYFFYLYWQGKTKILPLLTFTMGLYTSLHPILFPFYLVFLLLLFLRWKFPKPRIRHSEKDSGLTKNLQHLGILRQLFMLSQKDNKNSSMLLNLKLTLLSIITFIFPVTPLLAFEYFRGFAMTKQIFTMLTQSSGDSPPLFERLSTFIQYILDRFPSLLQSHPSLNVIIALLLITILIWLFIKHQNHPTIQPSNHFHKLFLPITFTIFLIYYALFPKNVPSYYLLALYTLLHLYLAAALSLISGLPLFSKEVEQDGVKLKNWKLNIGILIIILTSSAYHNIARLNREYWSNPSLTTLYHKDFIVKQIISHYHKNSKIRKFENSNVYISYIAEPGWSWGFPYLFDLYGVQQAEQPIPGATYTIVIPKRMSPDSINISSGNIGIILPDE